MSSSKTNNKLDALDRVSVDLGSTHADAFQLQNNNNKTTDATDAHKKPHDQKLKYAEKYPKYTYLCGTPWRACLGLSSLALILLIILVPVILLVIVPLVVDMFVNATSMTLVSGVLARPTATSLVVQTTIEINNAGPIPGTLNGFNATLYNDEGSPIGWMLFPEVSLAGNGPTLITVASTLTVTSPDAMFVAGRKLLAGESQRWEVRGDTSLVALGIGFPAKIHKDLVMPGCKLEGMRTSNIAVTSGNGTSGELIIEADVSFFSSSVLSFYEFGDLDVSLFYDVDGNDQYQYTAGERVARSASLPTSAMAPIGTATMLDFRVSKGLNERRLTIRLGESRAVGKMLGRWVAQWDQTVVALGPTNKGFLDGTFLSAIALDGAREKMFTGSLLTHEAFVTGFKSGQAATMNSVGAVTPNGCDFYDQKASVCDKGAFAYGKNPFSRGWFIRDIVFDVFFEDALTYEATFNIDVVGITATEKTFQCASQVGGAGGDLYPLVRLVSKPGMWSSYSRYSRPADAAAGIPPYTYDDTSARLADDLVSLDAEADFSFFLTAEPMPGVAELTNLNGDTGPCIFGQDWLDPFDCCMTTGATARACKAEMNGEKFLTVIARGNATLLVDSFSIEVETEIKMPLAVTQDVLNFNAVDETPGIQFVAEAGFDCTDFRFLS